MSDYQKLLDLYSKTIIERHELLKAKAAMESTEWEADAAPSQNNMTKWVTREQGIECIRQAIISCDLYINDLECSLENKDYSMLE